MRQSTQLLLTQFEILLVWEEEEEEEGGIAQLQSDQIKINLVRFIVGMG